MRPADRLAAKLAAGEVVLLDGATGTELQRRGAPMDDEAWCALATPATRSAARHPRGLCPAGCDVITANTFASARHLLERAGHSDRTRRARGARSRSRARRGAARGPGSRGRRLALDHAAGPSRARTSATESTSVPLVARANLREAAETAGRGGRADLLLLEMICDSTWRAWRRWKRRRHRPAGLGRLEHAERRGGTLRASRRRTRFAGTGRRTGGPARSGDRSHALAVPEPAGPRPPAATSSDGRSWPTPRRASSRRPTGASPRSSRQPSPTPRWAGSARARGSSAAAAGSAPRTSRRLRGGSA